MMDSITALLSPRMVSTTPLELERGCAIDRCIQLMEFHPVYGAFYQQANDMGDGYLMINPVPDGWFLSAEQIFQVNFSE